MDVARAKVSVEELAKVLGAIARKSLSFSTVSEARQEMVTMGILCQRLTGVLKTMISNSKVEMVPTQVTVLCRRRLRVSHGQRKMLLSLVRRVIHLHFDAIGGTGSVFMQG